MMHKWFYACFAASLPLMVLAPKGIVILFIVTFLGVIVLAENRHKILKDMIQSRFLWSLGALGSWGLITLLWSLEPQRGLSLGLGLILMWGMGGFIIYALMNKSPNKPVPKLQGILETGFVLATLLLLIEAKTQGGILTFLKGQICRLAIYNTATSMLVILFPCLMLYFWRHSKKKYSEIAILLVFVVSIFILQSSTSQIVLALVPFMVFFFYRFPLLIKIVGGMALISQVLMPWLMRYVFTYENARHYLSFPLKSSLYHRLKMWEFTATQIFEKPFLGWGLDSSRADFFAKVKDKFEMWHEGNKTYMAYEDFMLSLHPHNAALQIWLELGFVGIVLWVIILGLILNMIMRVKDKIWQSVMATSFFSSLLIAHNAYGIWQSWWVVTLIFCFAGVYGLYREENRFVK